MIENPYPSPSQPPRALALTADQVVKELQTALTVALRVGRNEHAAMAAILDECRNADVEKSRLLYAYKRGEKLIHEPSIRLVEIIAQHWGHFRYGYREVERAQGHSVVAAFAWDLATNVFFSRDFHVPHILETRQGPRHLESTRDIYEMVANVSMRRVRACALNILPNAVKEAAKEQCLQSLYADKPLSHQDIRSLVAAFEKIGVSKEMLRTHLGRPIQEATGPQIADLRVIFRTIRDEGIDPERFFPADVPEAEDGAPVVIVIGEQVFSPKGQPFNAEIHAASRTCTREGDWRRRRGVSEERLQQVEQSDRDALDNEIRAELRTHGVAIPDRSESQEEPNDA